MKRIYLDHNATTALRPEARQAMCDAMDLLGNPSSIHAEGRAAKALMERARDDLSAACGASGSDVVFTSGASEAAAAALSGRDVVCAAVEHPCVLAYARPDLELVNGGLIDAKGDEVARQLANSETGVVQRKALPVWFEDAVQAFGKIPYAFSWRRALTGAISAHKIGGPKGVGALLLDPSLDLPPILAGGGQEGARRAGTENLIGIAGFAAAAIAAERDVATGRWEALSEMRDAFEMRLMNECPDLQIAGYELERLPNTSCLIVPGWKGETQVMQLDLSGFAVSAGSACSSGKVRVSGTLQAMGYDSIAAGSSVRISMGLNTTQNELDAFAACYTKLYQQWRNKAA